MSEHTMNEKQMDAAGLALARGLGLKRDKEHKDRWRTNWGTKTSIGLFLTLCEQINQIKLGAAEWEHECDNCHWVGPTSLLKEKWPHIAGLFERIDPGGEVPSGSCPKCHALCYKLKS